MVWTFAGREREVADCLDAVSQHRCVAVLAPPAVGLSRLLDEIADEGFLRLDGNPTNLVRLTATAALTSLPLAALAPLLHDVDTDRIPPNEVVVRAVQSAARRFRSQSSMLVIDDAHELDLLSIEVLHGLNDRTDLDLHLLLGVSSQAILPARLCELWSSGKGSTRELAALSREQMRTVLPDSTLDSDVVHEITCGRVLLAHELVQSGGISEDGNVPARLGHAIDRFLGPLDSGAMSLVEFLSFAGPAPTNLFSSIESTLASLERRDIAMSSDGMVSLAVPLVAEVVASRLTDRRRRALHAVMVARCNDAWRASGVDLWHLTLWDARGTRVLPSQRYIDATRWALDDRRLDSAIELGGVAASKATELVAGDVLALEVEVAAALDTSSAESGYRRMLETSVVGDDAAQAQRVVFNSLVACVRRGDLSTGSAIALLEEGRNHNADQATTALLTTVLAEVMWLTGLTSAAAAQLARLDLESLDPVERRAFRAMQLSVDTEGGHCARALDHAHVLLRTLDARQSRQFDIARANQVFGHCYAGNGATTDVGIDGANEPRTVHAARAICLLLTGNLTAAREVVRAHVETSDQRTDSIGTLEHPLVALAHASAASAELACRDGAWKRWAELTAAVAAVSSSRPVHPTLVDRLVALSDLHLESGSLTTGLSIAHLIARLGRADLVASQMAAVSIGERDVVLSAMAKHCRAKMQHDPGQLLEAGTAFADAGWHASASDALADATVAAQESDDMDHALISVLAHHLAAKHADPIALLASAPTGVVTPREFDVIELAARGERSAAIAACLGTSIRTTDNHLYRMYRRFDLGGRSDLIDAFLTAQHLAGSTEH